MNVIFWPFNNPKLSNKYTKIYGESINYFTETNVSNLSHSSFLSNSIDVYHIHWPETYLAHKNILKTLIGTILVLTTIFCMKFLKGAKIVWTVHNVRPHDTTERFYYKYFYRILSFLTDGLIFLSNTSKSVFFQIRPEFSSLPNKVLSHILYPNECVTNEVENSLGLPGKYLLFFGLIKKYKNIDTLASVFSSGKINDNLLNDYSLIIAGKADDHEIENSIKNLNSNDIFLLNRHVSNEELSALISNSDGVVLPYTEITNSGALFHALSYGKKILVSDSPYFLEIKEQFPENIFVFHGELSVQVLSEFIGFINISNRQSDILSNYNKNIAIGTVDFYRYLKEL